MTSPVQIDCELIGERPLPAGFHYLHPKALYIGTNYDGCCEMYRCPNCDTEFSVEMPQ